MTSKKYGTKKHKFDGETFTAISQNRYKDSAQALAKQYRGMGYKARVVEIGSKKRRYRVFVRKK